jgi:hypothetical protein
METIQLINAHTLYECFNARVRSKKIYCKKGHFLFVGLIQIGYDDLRLGEPLNCNACQGCRDFDYIGEPLPERERGWIY